MELLTGRRIGRVVILGIALAAPAAWAQKVFKCVDETGKVTFQQSSCPGKSPSADAVTFQRSPTLTDEERFKGAAYRAGMTPEEAVQLLQGSGSNPSDAAPATRVPQSAPRSVPVADQDPEDTGLRCTAANGKIYYRSRSEGCGTSRVFGDPQVRNWQRDQVTGVPGAVMLNNNQALDPRTGQVLNLTPAPTTVRPSQRVQDQADIIGRDTACEEAKRDAQAQRDRNMDLSFDERRKIDDHVYELCKPKQGGFR
jgi:hypothetical protein